MRGFAVRKTHEGVVNKAFNVDFSIISLTLYNYVSYILCVLYSAGGGFSLLIKMLQFVLK